MHTNVFDLIGSQAKKKTNEKNEQNTQKNPYVMIFEMKICKV